MGSCPSTGAPSPRLHELIISVSPADGLAVADLTKLRVVPLFGNGTTGLGLTGTF
jgi:hypothetical protein